MGYRNSVQTGASEDRLVNLIEKRLEKGADVKAIDERIWNLFGETWAIMFTDLSGFSRNVAEFGIIHFLQTIVESQRILIPVIEERDGILLKTEGDSFLVLFRSPVLALACSRDMMDVLEAYNADKRPEHKILLCVGLGYGHVLKLGDADVYGAEVNAASKLGEDTAKAGEILVTGAIRDAAKDDPRWSFDPISEIPPGADRAYRAKYAR